MSNPSDRSKALNEEIIHYYRQGREATRLSKGIGLLEYQRTRELIGRYLPQAPQIILDVGGGPGVYACWLARLGYEVHLIDIVPLHVAQAKAASSAQQDAPLASYVVGDARSLQVRDGAADALLLYGPLYHLLEKRDRLRALVECRRALRPGGLLLAVGISRFASLYVGLVRSWIEDDCFRQMVNAELADGRHLPPQSWPGLFTTAYFHHPDQLAAEVRESGFEHLATLAVEGAGWLVPDFEERWQIDRWREAILTAVRWTEQEHTVLGISPHIMVVARK
jgi:ubiquinone/menaquinone biosynthesis C-methylase UbiE